MNVHESDKITALLELDGFARGESETVADIVVFNTCTVRNTAEDKIISHIGALHYEKKHGRNVIIGVVGCLSQRDGVAKRLAHKFPLVDIILGTHNIGEIGFAVKNAQAAKRTIDVAPKRRESDFDTVIPAHLRKDNNHFINITYGCENYCTYCIVPFVRGALICRPSKTIIAEFKTLTDSNASGVVFLLGQNVNSYVCPDTGTNFVGLLDKLCDMTTNQVFINFLSSHPRDFSDELVDFIASHPQIERNIHLPLQSGSDKILERMNRGYTSGWYAKKVANLRAKVPDIRITTDIICGFPGETDEDFADTVAFVKQIGFNSAFIFPYSRRSGTAADKMPNQIDLKTKKARTTQLQNIFRRKT